MRTRAQLALEASAELGYAADELGRGVAYLRLAQGGQIVRFDFSAPRLRALDAREVGYAALTAAAALLRKRGIVRVDFTLADEQLVDEVAQRRTVPQALVLPYVRLLCALNALDRCSLRHAATDDLTSRARADVALHAAA
jgi:hypothetical protein